LNQKSAGPPIQNDRTTTAVQDATHREQVSVADHARAAVLCAAAGVVAQRVARLPELGFLV
jgi:hypothetical protein